MPVRACSWCRRAKSTHIRRLQGRAYTVRTGALSTSGGPLSGRSGTVGLSRGMKRPQAAMSAQSAALQPLVPGYGPVAVLPDVQRLPAGVVDFDDITWLGEVVKPCRVVCVEVQTSVGRVGVALGPHRGVQFVEINAVGADAGGVLDRLAVTEPGVDRQPEGRGIHDDRVALVQDRVHARRRPE